MRATDKGAVTVDGGGSRQRRRREAAAAVEGSDSQQRRGQRSRAVDGGDSRRLRSVAAAVKGVRWQRRRTATAVGSDDGDSGRRWPGMMIYLIGAGGGSNANIILLSIVALSLGEASENREVSRKSPGSLQEVLSQLLPDS